MEVRFDREEIERRIAEYFSLYDEVTGERIYEMCEAKIEHSHMVGENCNNIAVDLGFSRYDTDIAWIIGETHDFGRFGQIIVTETFRDSDAWNHAHVGADLLFGHDIINDLIPNWDEISQEDRNVMFKAVHHHSDFHLPEDGFTERELTFCKIIREADQMDIFRTIVVSGWNTIYGHSKEEILASDFSDEIIQAFYRHELADYSKRTTYADYHLAHIALCFGMQNPASRHVVWEQGYLRQMMDIEFTQPAVQEKYLRITDEVMKFLNS